MKITRTIKSYISSICMTIYILTFRARLSVLPFTFLCKHVSVLHRYTICCPPSILSWGVTVKVVQHIMLWLPYISAFCTEGPTVLCSNPSDFTCGELRVSPLFAAKRLLSDIICRSFIIYLNYYDHYLMIEIMNSQNNKIREHVNLCTCSLFCVRECLLLLCVVPLFTQQQPHV